MSDVSVLTLESEESCPPNIPMREAACFAHWIREQAGKRSYDDDDQPDSQGLDYWWRQYAHHGRDEFQGLFRVVSGISSQATRKRYAEWEERYRAEYYLHTDDIYHRRMDAMVRWEDENPRPDLTFSNLVVEFCRDCGEPKFFGDWFGSDQRLCRKCFEESYRQCNRCGQVYRNTEDHYHPPPPRPGSKCIAKHERFRMPNKLIACGYQPSDRIVRVQGQGAGMVPDSAFAQITRVIRQKAGLPGIDYMDSRDFQILAGPEWETRDGKLSKRLANLIYKRMSYKLPPDVVTEIGNIARQSMSTSLDYRVEFTRKLDRPAREFANSDSCWWTGWGDNNRMRCVLKANGGLAMRTFSLEGSLWSSGPSVQGRAWVVPLDENLYATHDTMGASGYMLFNAYEESGQILSSILSAMTGKKCVSHLTDILEGSGMFVNSGSVYLIADRFYDDETAVNMLVDNSNIECSCVTHKDDEVEPYEEDDSDFEEAGLDVVTYEESDDYIESDDYDDEDEEPDDGDF